ncbi:MAG: hypothetical protein H7A23_26365 [Leptospiraceae bacterium]|nr:hypothetical protein [Leptospiraceae bacterium]MCP5498096.1 hypothetical protein [Leptospiraceae bacterium]
MKGLDILQSVQFITIKGNRLAILDANEWNVFIEWLEDLEDIQIGKSFFSELKEAGGDRQKTGMLKWQEVEQELE